MAEIIVGELARAGGLTVPEIVLIDLPADLSRTEPDPEIQDLIRASAGLINNIAFDYLPGATMFDPVADRPDPALAASIVWLDALTLNVDRTARNPNLLMWHRRLWLIDHGAALHFHHRGGDYRERARDAFPLVAEHVLLPFAAPAPRSTIIQCSPVHTGQCRNGEGVVERLLETMVRAPKET
jgi:hypothetical protein